MSGRDVVITGAGAVGAFGVGTDALGACLAGDAAPETREYALAGGALTVAQGSWRMRQHWPRAPRKLGRVDRSSQLALLAGHIAASQAVLDRGDGTACVLGTRFGCVLVNADYHEGLLLKGHRLAAPMLFGYTVPSAPAGELSIAQGLTGPNLTLLTGDASGGVAVARAAGWIRRGRVERALAGGVDAQGAWLAQELLDGGHDPDRDALPGEGAGVLVLESRASAAARGARPLATLGRSASGFLDADGPGSDPLASAIGRTYAASAPLMIAAMAAGVLETGPVRVVDDQRQWVEIEVLAADV